MPRGQGRGGYRKPAHPAPTAGPGALSRRTDGGPADPQPMRLPSGGAYGDRQKLAAQQSAAPMAGGSGVPQPTAGGGVVGAPPPATIDPFAPTQRPGEPITAGVPIGPGPSGMGMLPDDPDETLRVMWAMHNDPDIAELLTDRAMR